MACRTAARSARDRFARTGAALPGWRYRGLDGVGGCQQRRVYALCYRFTASSHDAEDLTQDVFIKLYANLRSFDSAKGSFQPGSPP